jgi:alkanesulfonate monooxygenase SsuD/methylene tetrahydromethanopterin reductase-like flavin-dependent oxidoreductase (luciferase family)
MFVETLHLLKRLWSEEEVTHHGDFWDLDEACISPRPENLGLWIGGHADIAIKRAAYRSDGWIASASSTPEDLAHQIGVYEDALEEFEKPRGENEVVLMRDCYVADTVEEAREAVEPHLLTLYEWYARWGQTYMDEHEVEVDWDDLEEKFVMGPPETVAEDLRAYEDLGVDHFVLRVQFPGQSQASTLRCLERLGDEVIPELR